VADRSVSVRARDMDLLRKLLEYELGETTRLAVQDMLDRLNDHEQIVLSGKQRTWMQSELEKRQPTYENLVSSGRAPRGREVPTLDILDPAKLPKRPPGRSAT